MKIYLDDVRKEPSGWHRCYWPNQVIELLSDTEVTDISLDHDLGDDSIGTGYDVLVWIEEQVYVNNYSPPKISIHTANTAAKARMISAVDSIARLCRRQAC